MTFSKTVRKGLPALLGIVATISTGCMSYKGGEMPRLTYAQFSNVHESEQVKVHIEPFETSQEAKGVFVRDVTSKGYLPILTRIENRSNESLSFDPREVLFTDNKGENWSCTSANEMAFDQRYKLTKKDRAIMTLAFILSPIGAIAGSADAERFYDGMRKDYIQKMIAPGEILPNSAREGFFVLKKGREEVGVAGFTDLLENGELSIYLNFPSGEEKVDFIFGDIRNYWGPKNKR